jgi:hypothetical protein
VEEFPPGPSALRRRAAYRDRTAAETAALLLVQRYALDGYRIVERLHEGARWTRWVLRHDRRRTWAAIELRERGAGRPEDRPEVD